MTPEHPYTPPAKVAGREMVQWNTKMEAEFKEAIQTFAQQESEKYGVKISIATLLKDLLTKDTPAIRQKRTELRQHYRKIKETNHHANETETTQPTDIH